MITADEQAKILVCAMGFDPEPERPEVLIPATPFVAELQRIHETLEEECGDSGGE